MPEAYSLDLRERVARFVEGGRSCRAAAALFSVSAIRHTSLPPDQPGKILNALATASDTITLAKFTGKSDTYLWFIVHATQFLKSGG